MNEPAVDNKLDINELTREKRFLLLDKMYVDENPQFEHRPAQSIREFCLGGFYLGLKGQIWETVMGDLESIYKSGKKEVWLYEAIGSGKSYLDSIISLYEVHKVLCLKTPQLYFGLSKTSKIGVLNMSVREKQAYDIVFSEAVGKMENSYWFQKFGHWNKDKKSEIQFNKNVFMIPGNSKETTPIGYSLIAAILDEACWFVDNAEKDNAEAVYYQLKRRIFSRFGDYGKLVVSTSPRDDSDFVSKKIKDGIPSNIFFVNRTLWEARKQDFVDDVFVEVEKGVKIPERMVGDFKENPEMFKRDLMGIAIGSLERYFKDSAMVSGSLNLKNNWSQDGILSDYKPKESAYYGHCDLGLKRDACGIALVHKDKNGMIINDFLVRLKAEKGGEVNIQGVRDIIYSLKSRGFTIRKFTFDGWQSADSIQQLNAKGIESEVLSVDRTLAPYDTLKGLIYRGGFKGVDHPVLRTELTKLNLVKGKKVDHPKFGSKDLGDALAGAVYNCMEFEERPEINSMYGREFAEKYHVKHFKLDELSVGTTRFMCLVPRLNGLSFALWCLADRNGLIYFYRERVFERASSSVIASEIARAEYQETISERYQSEFDLDKKDAEWYNLIEQLDDEGFDFVQKEYNEELASINIREGLRFDKSKPISGENHPFIFISPECKETIRVLKFFMNPEYQKNPEFDQTVNEAIGLMILAEPMWEKA